MKIKLENDPVASVIAFVAGGVTAEPAKVTTRFELAAKPLPDIVTGVPIVPIVGFIEVISGVTVKKAVAALLLELLSVAVTV